MKSNEKIVKTEVVNKYKIREIFENGYYRDVIFYGVRGIKIDCIQYYNSKSECHRTNDKPSFISYYKNGNIEGKVWEQNDNYHRLAGPSWIDYNVDGKITNERYCINGKAFTKEEFENHPERILYKNLKIFK